MLFLKTLNHSYMINHLAVISLVLILSSACNKTEAPPVTDAEIDINVLAEKLSYPWELVWGPDDKLWMTEKGGRISRVDPTSGAIDTVFTIPDVVARGEGGLLGMALHPDFTSTPQVFVVYDYNNGANYNEKVVRYNYVNGTLASPLVILDNINASGIHNGSRLLFTSDKKLLITTGDASNSAIAQNQSALNGKILRINTDGSIPADNPDPTSPVWTWGHRNPQGLVFGNNILYSSEHGPSNDDEINIIEKGRNYGWPNVEGVCNTMGEQTFCTANNIKEPIYNWTPTLAVCGIDFYTSNTIPQWKNSLLLATLKDNTLYHLKLSADAMKVDSVFEIFRGTYGRLRDVCIAPDGKVYISTSNGSNDKIIKISKKN